MPLRVHLRFWKEKNLLWALEHLTASPPQLTPPPTHPPPPPLLSFALLFSLRNNRDLKQTAVAKVTSSHSWHSDWNLNCFLIDCRPNSLRPAQRDRFFPNFWSFNNFWVFLSTWQFNLWTLRFRSLFQSLMSFWQSHFGMLVMSFIHQLGKVFWLKMQRSK